MKVLPADLECKLRMELRQIEGGDRMPYITGFERDGMVKGTRKSVLEVLQARFETVPAELNDRLNAIGDRAVLTRLLRQAATMPSVEAFQQALSQSEGAN